MNPTTLKAYKIRNPKTGLFQKAGSGAFGEALWSTCGKVWNTLGHLKSHFTLMRSYAGRRGDPVDPNWEIIELSYVESQSVLQTVGQLLAADDRKAQEREARRVENHRREAERVERLEYERLKVKFDVPKLGDI